MQPRLVSLVPAATEMIALLGAENQLVGRSHECDFPRAILDRPALTRPGVRLNGLDPAEIDRRARAAAGGGTALVEVDADLLRELRPDIVVVQDLCGLCAAHERPLHELLEALPSPPTLITLKARTVEGMLDDLIALGGALDRLQKATEAAVALRERFFRAAEFVNPYADGPVVGFLEWPEPLFIAGHWTVQLIERAGGRHPLNPTVPRPGTGTASGPQHAEAVAGRSIAVTPELFAASRPEHLVLCPCGLPLEETRAAARRLGEQPWFRDLPAARAGRVALVDGNQMFNRPGPRLADAFEWLVGWLHDRPGLIPPGFPWSPQNPGLATR